MAYCTSPVTHPKLARLNVIEKYLYLRLGDRRREKLITSCPRCLAHLISLFQPSCEASILILIFQMKEPRPREVMLHAKVTQVATALPRCCRARARVPEVQKAKP